MEVTVKVLFHESTSIHAKDHNLSFPVRSFFCGGIKSEAESWEIEGYSFTGSPF